MIRGDWKRMKCLHVTSHEGQTTITSPELTYLGSFDRVIEAGGGG